MMRVVAALGALDLMTRRDHSPIDIDGHAAQLQPRQYCAITAALSAARCSTLCIVNSHGWRFFREDVLRWLAWREVGYAIKVPFYRWLDLQQFIRSARRPGRE